MSDAVKPSSKSNLYELKNDHRSVEKQTHILGYPQPVNEVLELQLNGEEKTKCSDTWISLAESEDSASQQSSLGEYRQLSLWKSTPTLRQSCDRNSQEFQFTQTSETISQDLTSSTLSQWDFPAQAHQMQEVEQDSNIQLHLFGEKDLDALLKLNPASVLSNNLKELSNGDFELFLADSLWQDTLGKLAMSRQQSLARVIKDSGYLSFPTLTSNVSTTSRPAGQTKCEKWFKDKGLIPSGCQLGTRAIAQVMGFPSSWFERLTEQYSDKTSTPSQVKPQAESEQGIWQEEPLHQHKQPLPSAESSTSTRSRHPNSVRMLETTAVLLGGKEELLEHEEKCSSPCSEVLLGGEDNSPLSTESSSSPNQGLSIPCLVKQPKQAEVKGFIRKDEGDRFLVDIGGETISVSKLFVYPDFSKTVGQIEKSPRKNITPSTNNPRKRCDPGDLQSPKERAPRTRRKKGQGNGTIYYRTVTKNGKQYQEAYYHYRSNGKKRTKYIPKKLLDRVNEAESLKLPVSEILILLGGDKKNPRKSSSTSLDKVAQKINDGCIEKQVLETDEENPRKIIPPSKKRRKQGEGSGWIECKPIKRSGKEYKQYWYHYEEWREGDRKSKKSRYIPKRLVSRVEKMEAEKVSVKEIIEVFHSKRKKSVAD